MRSLRIRLAGALAAVGLVVTMIAAIAITYERWQEESRSLPAAVELEAIRLAELTDRDGLSVPSVGGRDRFALLFDLDGAVVAQQGLVEAGALELGRQAWSETVDFDIVVSFADPVPDGRERFVSAAACLDRELCDTAVAGASTVGFVEFVVPRLGWILGLSLAVGVAGLVAGRWLVGRALEPVEAMRAELEEITGGSLERRVPVAGSGDEIQHLGETLNATLDRLQGASSAIERFAADAAHELRSPITGARAAMELRAADDELLRAGLVELDRAAALIDDLLFLARNEGVPARRVDVDVDEVVRSAIASARARHPEVVFTIEAKPVRVVGDPAAIARLAINLIENAATYGSGRVHAGVDALADDWARIVVEDDGPGVPEKERARIFERFGRVDESRSRRSGGTGLGLAIASEIASAHGGSISVDDGDLGGARFAVLLRLASTEAGAPPS